MKTIFVRAALCALSFGALCMRVPAIMWPLVLAALWLLHGAMLKLSRPFAPKRLWGLAVLFAGVITLGHSFNAAGSAEWALAHPKETVLSFAGLIPLSFAAMRLLMHVLCLPGRHARRLRVPAVSGGLLLCWLPWYVCLFPGTVSNDSVSQLKIILGLAPWSNANPICQTGLVGLFRQLGIWLGGGADLAVALYCVVQSALMVWLLGSLICEMARAHAPRALVWGSFAFYALCPIFPVFAFCVGKDTNFAMAVLFLALEVWRVTHLADGERLRPVRVVCLCIASAACVLLRNPGIYLVVLTLAFLLIWGIRRRLWLAPLCGLLCAAAVFLTLHMAVIPTLDIAPMPETEEYSIPLQHIARAAAANALTEEQTEALSGVLPVEKLKAAYNGELSDPVKDLWYADATEEQKAAFWPAWLSVLKDNPMTCLSATFHNTYGYLYPGYVSTIKPTLIIGNHSTRTAHVTGYFDYTVNPLSTPLKAFTDRLNTIGLYRVLISPGLYGWLTLLCAVWLTRGRDRRALLCAIPALFTLAGCMLSAVNGYFRYAMPLYISAPLLMWLMQQHGSKQ